MAEAVRFTLEDAELVQQAARQYLRLDADSQVQRFAELARRLKDAALQNPAEVLALEALKLRPGEGDVVVVYLNTTKLDAEALQKTSKLLGGLFLPTGARVLVIPREFMEFQVLPEEQLKTAMLMAARATGKA